MGVCSCEIHGTQSFIEACSHISEALRRNVVLHRNRVFDLLNLEVCDACFQQYDLGRFASESFPEFSAEAEATYDLLHADLRCRCLECVAAAELAAVRAGVGPTRFQPMKGLSRIFRMKLLRS